MKKSYLTLIISLVTVSTALAFFLFWHRPALLSKKLASHSNQTLPDRSQAPLMSPNDGTTDEERKRIVREKMAKVGFKMSDQEFNCLRIKLPHPINAPWEGPFYNSQTCFDNDRVKLAAVEVLPIWIRKAITVGEPELAASYLWSYLRFTDDKNQEIATNAVINLYRMGDSDDIAFDKMRYWIESGFNYSYLDIHAGNPDDIRQQVLQELDFYKDSRMDGIIYDTWSKNKDNEGADLASVDYAYYLEKHGQELPSDYWLNRLNQPYAFENALDVLETRKPEGVTEKLQPLFEQLRTKPSSSPDAGRAADVASALFQLTGSASYRDYLISQAQAQLASNSIGDSLPQTFKALAATNDKSALDVLSTAIQSKNTLIRETAIDALGNARNPEASEMLFESAIQEAKTRFPSHQLRALLQQNDPSSDSKYERLQQALLSGQLGWQAASSDFAAMEFTRKYGRH